MAEGSWKRMLISRPPPTAVYCDPKIRYTDGDTLQRDWRLGDPFEYVVWGIGILPGIVGEMYRIAEIKIREARLQTEVREMYRRADIKIREASLKAEVRSQEYKGGQRNVDFSGFYQTDPKAI
jgi:hypothetical protein